MATVYSYVCWGGAAGKTVTFTDSGDVVNLTKHGLRNGTPIQFTNSGGALPTGLTANTTYYSKEGADADKFTLWTDATLTTQVTFTGTGSGTTTCKSKHYLDMTTGQKERYTTGATERIYNGIKDWRDTRNSVAARYDTEVCEIGHAFTEENTSALTIDIPCTAATVTTYVNGIKSEAHHNSVRGAGFIFKVTTGSAVSAISLGGYNRRIIGFTVFANGNACTGILLNKNRGIVAEMWVIGNNNASNGAKGFNLSSQACIINACVSTEFKYGIELNQYSYNSILSNCVFYKNLNTGVYTISGTTTNVHGFFYNNISIDNTTANWHTASSAIEGADRNAGVSGDSPWATTGGSSLTMATTDFLDYANNDLRPASKTSPQVINGALIVHDYQFDLKHIPQPAYIDITHRFAYDGESSGPFVLGERLSWGSGGTAGTGVLLVLDDDGSTGNFDIHLTSGVAPTDNETITGGTSSATCAVNGTVTEVSDGWMPAIKWSIGPLEYDFGGPTALVTITLQNVVDGSRYRVYNVTTSTEIATGVQSGSGDIVISNVPYNGTNETLQIRVRKAGGSTTDYLPFETNATLTSTGATVWVSQQLDELTQ